MTGLITMVDRVERFISPLRKAWVSPDGEVHQFEFGHHADWLLKNRDEFPKDALSVACGDSIHEAEKAGWVRLTRRGEALDVEGVGMPSKRIRSQCSCGPDQQFDG